MYTQTLSRMLGSSTHKENSTYMVSHQYRKLEEMLAREKAHAQQLATQLSKARAEVVALKAQGMNINLSVISHSFDVGYKKRL